MQNILHYNRQLQIETLLGILQYNLCTYTYLDYIHLSWQQIESIGKLERRGLYLLNGKSIF